MIAGGEIEGDADHNAVVVSDDFIEGLPSWSTKGKPSIPSRPPIEGDIFSQPVPDTFDVQSTAHF